jgi:hypothetical protein
MGRHPLVGGTEEGSSFARSPRVGATRERSTCFGERDKAQVRSSEQVIGPLHRSPELASASDLPRSCVVPGAPYGRDGSSSESSIKPEQLRCLPGRGLPLRATTCNPRRTRSVWMPRLCADSCRSVGSFKSSWNDSGDSTGAFCPLRATTPPAARRQTTPTAISESLMGISGATRGTAA